MLPAYNEPEIPAPPVTTSDPVVLECESVPVLMTRPSCITNRATSWKSFPCTKTISPIEFGLLPEPVVP